MKELSDKTIEEMIALLVDYKETRRILIDADGSVFVNGALGFHFLDVQECLSGIIRDSGFMVPSEDTKHSEEPSTNILKDTESTSGPTPLVTGNFKIPKSERLPGCVQFNVIKTYSKRQMFVGYEQTNNRFLTDEAKEYMKENCRTSKNGHTFFSLSYPDRQMKLLDSGDLLFGFKTSLSPALRFELTKQQVEQLTKYYPSVINMPIVTMNYWIDTNTLSLIVNGVDDVPHPEHWTVTDQAIDKRRRWTQPIITNAIEAEIVAKYNDGGYSYIRLADEYEVSPSRIRRYVKNAKQLLEEVEETDDR